jgi:hypothetical protein
MAAARRALGIAGSCTGGGGRVVRAGAAAVGAYARGGTCVACTLCA